MWRHIWNRQFFVLHVNIGIRFRLKKKTPKLQTKQNCSKTTYIKYLTKTHFLSYFLQVLHFIAILFSSIYIINIIYRLWGWYFQSKLNHNTSPSHLAAGKHRVLHKWIGQLYRTECCTHGQANFLVRKKRQIDEKTKWCSSFQFKPWWTYFDLFWSIWTHLDPFGPI